MKEMKYGWYFHLKTISVSQVPAASEWLFLFLSFPFFSFLFKYGKWLRCSKPFSLTGSLQSLQVGYWVINVISLQIFFKHLMLWHSLQGVPLFEIFTISFLINLFYILNIASLLSSPLNPFLPHPTLVSSSSIFVQKEAGLPRISTKQGK